MCGGSATRAAGKWASQRWLEFSADEGTTQLLALQGRGEAQRGLFRAICGDGTMEQWDKTELRNIAAEY